MDKPEIHSEIGVGNLNKNPLIRFYFGDKTGIYQDNDIPDDQLKPTINDILNNIDSSVDFFNLLKELLKYIVVPGLPSTDYPYINAPYPPPGWFFNRDKYDEIFFSLGEQKAQEYLQECEIFQEYMNRDIFDIIHYYDLLSNEGFDSAEAYRLTTRININIKDYTINGKLSPPKPFFDSELYDIIKNINPLLAEEYKNWCDNPSLITLSDLLKNLIIQLKDLEYLQNLLNQAQAYIDYLNLPIFDIDEYYRILSEQGYQDAEDYRNGTRYNESQDINNNNLYDRLYFIFSSPDITITVSQFMYDMIISLSLFINRHNEIFENYQYEEYKALFDDISLVNMFLDESLSIKILNIQIEWIKNIIQSILSIPTFNELKIEFIKVLYIKSIDMNDLIVDFPSVYNDISEELDNITRNETINNISIDNNNKIIYDMSQNYYKYLSLINFFFYNLLGIPLTKTTILNILFRFNTMRKILTTNNSFILNLLNNPQNQKWYYEKLFVNKDSVAPLFTNKELLINKTLISIYKEVFKKYKEDITKPDSIIEQKFFGHLNTLLNTKPFNNFINCFEERDKLLYSHKYFLQQFLFTLLYFYEMLIRFIRYIGLHESSLYIPKSDYFNNIDLFINKYYHDNTQHKLFTFFYNKFKDFNIDEILENEEAFNILDSNNQYTYFLEKELLDIENIEIDNISNNIVSNIKKDLNISEVKFKNSFKILSDLNNINIINMILNKKDQILSLFTLLGSIDDVSLSYINKYKDISDNDYLFSDDGNPWLINSMTPKQLRDYIDLCKEDARRID
jgi:hypothetical protein